MEKTNELYELLYEDFESRILFGFYRYDEQLLSLQQLRDIFHMGRNTVQSALDKLEKNGYIETQERKIARVAYRGTREVFRENTAKYFVPRKEGILDFCYAGELLFNPMWEIAIHNPDADIVDYLKKIHGAESAMMVAMPIKLYLDVLRTFHNDLLLNLYWQCLRYLNFLYPSKREIRTGTIAEEVLSVRTMDDLKTEFDSYIDSAQNKVIDFIESARGEYHLEAVPQIPFKWNIYRSRPQVRYTLATVVIREIIWERYPVGSYLPSLPNMAEQYQVSLSTVRRTVAVLNSLGVTRTYMGIGTKVCLEPMDLNLLKKDEIRENMLLHGEGLQILALTVRGVALFTLESATKEKRDELLQEIRKLHGKTSSILCIDVLLSFISRECPSAMIRECYDKLRELAVWGYILSAVLMSTGQLDNDLSDFIGRLEKDLQSGDLASFSDEWKFFIMDRLNYFYLKFAFLK